MCKVVNGWVEGKHDQTDTYVYMKASLLAELSPDMDEHRLSVRERLASKRQKGSESIDELA